MNQEDEDKPFWIEKVGDGFEIRAFNDNSLYDLVVGSGEETEAAAWFKPHYHNDPRAKNDSPCMDLRDKECLLWLLNYWEGLR